MNAIHPDCQPFVAAVEELLARRRAERALAGGRDQAWLAGDWGPRSWHRTELEDMVYSSYKQMRKGRVTRPPRRDTVMEIADYLACTLEERNRLLIAAGATPVAPYLTGAELAEVLAVAENVARALPMPTVIINRDWRIHYLNEHMLTLFGVTAGQLAALDPSQLNVLRLLFDPALPLHPHLIQNQASWTRMARQTIYGFKQANLLSQWEGWFQEFVAQMMALPAFAEHWRTVGADRAFAGDRSARDQPSAVLLETTVDPSRPDSPRIWLRPILVSVGYFQFDFPQIIGFLPADEDGRRLFAALGLP